MPERRSFSPEMVSTFLNDLFAFLARSPRDSQLFVVGGAAMSLLNPARQATTDIDCWLRDRSLADEDLSSLSATWGDARLFLDEGVRQFTPTLLSHSEAFDHIMTIGKLRVMVAKPEVLLAMKLKASRLKDQGDIEFLVRHLGLTTIDEAEAILERCFPGDALTDKALARLAAAFGQAG